MEFLEEEMLYEILRIERFEFESYWQDLKIRVLDICEVVEVVEVFRGLVYGLG